MRLQGDIYFVGLDVFLGGICLRDFICLGFGLLVDDGERQNLINLLIGSL